jgi:hypothetical protein
VVDVVSSLKTFNTNSFLNMKKVPIILQILLMVFVVQGCNFLSAAGFDPQGQPVVKVTGNLTYQLELDNSKIDHSQWDVLLKKYVGNNGLVNYKGFLNDKDELEDYLDQLAQNPPDSSWKVQELLAYYINLYNAHTINLILNNYPINSIKDLNRPWTSSFVRVGNEKLTLGGVENSILRKMDDPRIHFAINCASYSCPDLLNEAYQATTIEEQLERVTFSFINGPKNELTESNIRLSKIFKWYKKDFKVNGQKDLIGYVNKYSKIKIKPDANLDFIEYNWDLNEMK